MVFHKSLLTVLNSKTKQKIVGFLLKHEALMSEREIAAVSGVSHMSINRIMRELAEMNFVHFVRAGRAHLWRINRGSYAFHILSGLFNTLSQKTAPFEDLKRTILDKLPLPFVENLILFGSIAMGTERFDSDIDLYVQVNLEGKTPSNGRREDPAGHSWKETLTMGFLPTVASLPAFFPRSIFPRILLQTQRSALEARLGRGVPPRPATKGAAPPWIPLRAVPRGKQAVR
jgi:hypothetical protein